MTSPFDEALLLALGAHADAVGRMERDEARRLARAYRQARSEAAETLTALWAARFGSRRPSRSEILQFVSSAEVAAALDGTFARLNLQTKAALEQALHAGSLLGYTHTGIESAALIEFFGGPGRVGTSMFGSPLANFDPLFRAALTAADGLDLDLRRAVQKSILDGGLAGEGITKLRRRLLAVRKIGENRADVSVRWAVMHGYNSSRFAAYEDAARYLPGMKKVWATANDDRVCPHCSAQHGQVLELAAEFDPTNTFSPKPLSPYGGVLRFPPLHPRCRCTLLPWFDRWEGLTTMTPADLRAQVRDDAEELGFL